MIARKNLLFWDRRAILVISPLWGYERGISMHEHEHTKAVLNRMSRAIGHMNAIKRMIEEGRDCSEILIQLSAVRAEITNTSKVILKDHLQHCVVDAIRENDETTLQNLMNAIDRIV